MFQKQIYGFGNKINHKYGFTKKSRGFNVFSFFEFFFSNFGRKIRHFQTKWIWLFFSLYLHLMSSCVFDDVMPISFWAWHVTVAPLRLRMTSFISNIDCCSPSSCWSLTFQAKELIGGFASPSQKTFIVSPSRYDNDGVDTVISGLA